MKLIKTLAHLAIIFMVITVVDLYADDTPTILNCPTKWLSILLDDQENLAVNTSKSFAVKSAYDLLFIKDSASLISTFNVEIPGCPSVFSLGIMNSINKSRQKICLDPLVFSPEVSQKAQAFVDENRDTAHTCKLNEMKYGQLCWRESYPEPKGPSLQIAYWVPFERDSKDPVSNNPSEKWQYTAKPLYHIGEDDTPASWRSFTDEEWKNTKEIGVGCSVYFTNDNEALYFYTVVFFNHPRFY